MGLWQAGEEQRGPPLPLSSSSPVCSRSTAPPARRSTTRPPPRASWVLASTPSPCLRASCVQGANRPQTPAQETLEDLSWQFSRVGGTWLEWSALAPRGATPPCLGSIQGSAASGNGLRRFPNNGLLLTIWWTFYQGSHIWKET